MMYENGRRLNSRGNPLGEDFLGEILIGRLILHRKLSQRWYDHR